MYHGTSLAALKRIREGREILPVYTVNNISLGGAYFTNNRAKARGHAKEAADIHKSTPVILLVVPEELLPDEDWVVVAFEDCPLLPDRETIEDKVHREFFDDLFVGYLPETSLSDHYKERYDELNRKHGITADFSLHWIKSARQEDPLHMSQIINIIPIH